MLSDFPDPGTGCACGVDVGLKTLAGLSDANVTVVDSAYTTKVCNKCQSFGERKGDLFECKCGEYHADINAALNIKKRKFDRQIGLYTPSSQVKKILEERIESVG